MHVGAAARVDIFSIYAHVMASPIPEDKFADAFMITLDRSYFGEDCGRTLGKDPHHLEICEELTGLWRKLQSVGGSPIFRQVEGSMLFLSRVLADFTIVWPTTYT